MNRLEYQLVKLCERNRDGSHTTQANRRAMFSLFTEQLKECGYKINQMRPSDLKGRHINALVTKWKAEGLSAGTVKNRMTALRWWAEKVGKPEIVKENSVYGIENRTYVTNQDKSVSIEKLDLSSIDENIAQSLRLQDAFGLRREESIKFQPEFALDGQTVENARYIRLKDSWTKGGRARTIPITNDKQRQELRTALRVAAGGSLIPVQKTYKTHLANFEAVTRKLEISKTHGLRHGYAQARYFELMGFACPAVGGYRELTAEEKEKDKSVRMQISEELGHSRLNITSVYLGSWSKK
ncbi:phage integrase N-terminal domain-containing protein [Acinetobacter baumannii]|uniref:phage integrase N-terminal domain-containing protein n=1 Tax=Acinetobacter baumannii TaxID=470 RepID=UPI002221E4B3|nr:phage integrase N-terminal domain-containing protein [Acinetobacter baumannii]MCW1473928.1 integrase domain-containing protein [Acinetobacter baumannii]MDV7431421.1 phage integrase N-terminal domain-containing protein [Acinetobacter baumannii]